MRRYTGCSRFVIALGILPALGCASESPSESDAGSGGSSGSSVGGAANSVAGSEASGASAGSLAQGGSAGTSFGGSGGTGGNTQGGGTGGEATGGSAVETPGTHPTLEPGVWVDISPDTPLTTEEAGNFTAGVFTVALDPSNPWTLYAGIELSGVWKSTDGGTSWEQLGPDPDVDLYDGATSQLSLPIALAIDPSDPEHLYATSGVRDSNNGFWVSHDGGHSWVIPQGFKDTSPTFDVTTMVVDPSDFAHVLIGSHAYYNMGVLETKDGGDSWTLHPPDPSWGGGSYGVNMLYCPALGIGDPNTWLVHLDGFWRTTNAGTSWSKVSDIPGVHGATEIYYASTGTLYSGAGYDLARSEDNGVTWEEIKQGVMNGAYYTVVGDGNTMYTQANGENRLTITSAESDGETWSDFGTQTLGSGSLQMRFEPSNRIIYSANWGAGVWAMKVDP